MKAKLYNQQLEASGEMDLNPKIFDVKPVAELVQQAVRIQMANGRTSTANTKTRGEVRGGGKKPWKQKGTGNARAGSTRSPIWRHGGITFGPRAERNYALKMNKKQWRKALYMTLSDKVLENNFFIFSEFNMDAQKTKAAAKFFADMQSKLAKTAKNFLIVLPKKDEKVEKSVRNLKYAKMILATSLNVVDLLNADALIMPQSSVAVIEKTYLKA